MGVPRQDAVGAVRFSFGQQNTRTELSEVMTVLKKTVAHLKENTPPLGS
jgi:cysteine sulfinate desulfinase/cysteine desulfurase-like protein